MRGETTALLPILAGVGVGVGTGNPALGFAVASGGMSVLGGFTAMQGANWEAEQMKQQAEDEKLAMKERANQIKRDLFSTLGTQRAVGAANGTSTGFGSTIDDIEAQTIKDAQDDLDVNRFNTLTQTGALNQQAQQTRQAGRAGFITGIAQGAMVGYDAYQRSPGKVPDDGKTYGKKNGYYYRPNRRSAYGDQ